jgi:hypothetical protein
MTTLFDKVSGSYDSFDANGITDSTASFKIDEFKNWYVTIASVEYQITSNTATTLSFSNALASTGSYEIAFVGRDYLNQLESDYSNTTKISDDLISKKYNQSNIDVSNRLVAYLRGLYGMNTNSYAVNGAFVSDFDPLANILNLDIMQQTFAYYMTYLVFKDLSLDTDSQNYFKSEDFFTLFKSTIKDSLALIQIDFNEDGEASNEEKRDSVSYTRLTR